MLFCEILITTYELFSKFSLIKLRIYVMTEPCGFLSSLKARCFSLFLLAFT